MKLLLDSHLLVWMAAQSQNLSMLARQMITDPGNDVFFSSASLWQLTIKHHLGKADLPVHPRVLHDALLANEYIELAVTSRHALALSSLPPIHRDPFDRILIAQSIDEGMTLLTADRTIAQYGAPVRLV
jgi:PIN domain nuclease of toxin-antitoxin system